MVIPNNYRFSYLKMTIGVFFGVPPFRKHHILTQDISAKDSYDVQYFRGGGMFRLNVPVMTLGCEAFTCNKNELPTYSSTQ